MYEAVSCLTPEIFTPYLHSFFKRNHSNKTKNNPYRNINPYLSPVIDVVLLSEFLHIKRSIMAHDDLFYRFFIIPNSAV